ncbi:MAG: hypothetical protein HIU91_15285 [Acidobacteria bacterium]|nr:hypothetical protein [Acidobacteriota bacterium]
MPVGFTEADKVIQFRFLLVISVMFLVGAATLGKFSLFVRQNLGLKIPTWLLLCYRILVVVMAFTAAVFAFVKFR